MKTSQAQKINKLLIKKKKLFQNKTTTIPFKEPTLFLIKKDRTVEFYEKATSGTFKYEHSDGEEREIILDPRYKLHFPMGDQTFTGYILHEDNPIPLPQDPVLTSEIYNISIDKTLNDIKKWKATEYTAKGNMIWKIALGICAIIGMYILYTIFAPPPTPEITQIIQHTQNLTTIP